LNIIIINNVQIMYIKFMFLLIISKRFVWSCVGVYEVVEIIDKI
jgi:hypothetical protein